MRQLLLDLLPESPPSLDNFVPGEGGGETLAALTEWLDGGKEFCFLLWGASGSGKTHLLFASGFAYHDAAEDADLSALQKEEDLPRWLAVDHVEALSATGQITLFHAFNRLRAAGGKLLAAARQSPSRLILREDLRTRLGSGWIYRLTPLTDAEKAKAMARQAVERAMPLSAEVIDYLLQHAPRDMRTLSGLVTALDRYALEAKRPVTLPLLRTLLRQERAASLES